MTEGGEVGLGLHAPLAMRVRNMRPRPIVPSISGGSVTREKRGGSVRRVGAALFLLLSVACSHPPSVPTVTIRPTDLSSPFSQTSSPRFSDRPTAPSTEPSAATTPVAPAQEILYIKSFDWHLY